MEKKSKVMYDIWSHPFAHAWWLAGGRAHAAKLNLFRLILKILNQKGQLVEKAEYICPNCPNLFHALWTKIMSTPVYDQNYVRNLIRNLENLEKFTKWVDVIILEVDAETFSGATAYTPSVPELNGFRRFTLW